MSNLSMLVLNLSTLVYMVRVYMCHTSYAAFRLACRSPHCRFDDVTCSTAQAPLATEGWSSGKQCLANRSITSALCPLRKIADSWILFNSGAMPLGDKAKATWPLRTATLKRQAMITQHSGKAASGKLVWNQHKHENSLSELVVATVHMEANLTIVYWSLKNLGLELKTCHSGYERFFLGGGG